MDKYYNPKTVRRRTKKRAKTKLLDLNAKAIECLMLEIKGLGRKIKALEETRATRALWNPDKLEQLKHIYNERTHYLKQHINKKHFLRS